MTSVPRLASIIVLSLATVARAVDITACGQEVPPGEVGVLTTDLDCGTIWEPGSFGVKVGRSATLDLQGHTIKGPQWAVFCAGPGRCTITSTTTPGTLTLAEAGIWTPEAKPDVSNVTFSSNAYGISNNKKTTVADVVFDRNGFALTSLSLRATNVTVSGHCDAYCFDMRKGRIDGLVASNTGIDATVFQVQRTIKLTNASITGSPGQTGILAKSIRLVNSTVTGHGMDLASRSLRLVGSSCGSSVRFDGDGFAIGSWGVCAND